MQIIRYLNNTRLAFFSIAYGLSGALIGGTLNRIMIAELGLPASLVAFFFAVPLLISPVRVWLGYRSDGYPIFGKRREPYIIFGAIGHRVGNCRLIQHCRASCKGFSASRLERIAVLHALRTWTQPSGAFEK